MAFIVPRWEWRTFGRDFGSSEAKFAALSAEKTQRSEEIYLITASSEANVKVRDQLIDIKRLDRVDDNGLEQWRPVLKAPFPLDHLAIVAVRSALGLPEAPSNETGMSLDRMLAELAPAEGPVRIVHVNKTRTRYKINCCDAEMTEVLADGKTIRTVAIEDADPSKVVAAVHAMELDRYPNISYPVGLRQLFGLAIGGKHE